MNSIEQQKKINLKWFKKFITICEENNIWYTVTNGTLLGTIREKGPIKWDDDYDVMMTPDSYAKLKKMFPSNCIDGTNETKYPLVIPKFIPDRKKFLESPIFVDIFIVVPTNDKHVKKFRSLKQKINFSMQSVHSTWRPYAWYIWLFKFVSWPLKFLIKKLTYKKAIEILTVHDGYKYFYTIDNPVDPKKINIINVLTYSTVEKPFNDFKVKVPIEYNHILKMKYGNYMVPNKWQRPFIHINTVSIKKVKKNI